MMCLPARFAKYQQIQQRVGAQAVGAVYRYRSAFAHGVQAIDHLVLCAIPSDHLAVDVGGDAAHLVVDGGHDGDGLFGDIDVGKVVANLFHRGQALANGFGAQVVQLHQDVVLVWGHSRDLL